MVLENIYVNRRLLLWFFWLFTTWQLAFHVLNLRFKKIFNYEFLLDVAPHCIIYANLKNNNKYRNTLYQVMNFKNW